MLSSELQPFLILFILVLAILLAGFLPGWLRRRRGVTAIRQAAQSTADGAGAGEAAALPEPWWELRQEVVLSNRTLTPTVFSRTRQLFLDYYAKGPLSPGDLTSEYGKEEFLLVVDEEGRPSRPVIGLVDTFQRIAAAHPAFARWFQVATLAEGEHAGQPVLLAARWLCHLAGFRHGTVEIFIDPPDLAGHTLVQVRGMDKFEAPGAFDIPCAGHISGIDSPEIALARELGEELNLSLDDLEAVRLVGRYNSFTGANSAQGDALKVNIEHRVLYRARIKPEAAARIRFTDGEVAGIAVFAVSELRALVQKYPERVASGLSDAMGFYER